MTRAIAIALILSCLAGAAWAGPVGAETIRLGGTGGPLEAMRLAGEAFHKTHPQTNVAIVPGLGSRGGIKALQAGAVDVAVSATPAPAAEPGLMW
jgi:phosphate transport system substrate-binding protein